MIVWGAYLRMEVRSLDSIFQLDKRVGLCSSTLFVLFLFVVYLMPCNLCISAILFLITIIVICQRAKLMLLRTPTFSIVHINEFSSEKTQLHIVSASSTLKKLREKEAKFRNLSLIRSPSQFLDIP